MKILFIFVYICNSFCVNASDCYLSPNEAADSTEVFYEEKKRILYFANCQQRESIEFHIVPQDFFDQKFREVMQAVEIVAGSFGMSEFQLNSGIAEKTLAIDTSGFAITSSTHQCGCLFTTHVYDCVAVAVQSFNEKGENCLGLAHIYPEDIEKKKEKLTHLILDMSKENKELKVTLCTKEITPLLRECCITLSQIIKDKAHITLKCLPIIRDPNEENRFFVLPEVFGNDMDKEALLKTFNTLYVSVFVSTTDGIHYTKGDFTDQDDFMRKYGDYHKVFEQRREKIILGELD